MGYANISNLYKDNRIFDFDECYSLEKIHGSSSHIKWSHNEITFFSGGSKYEDFIKIFDKEDLIEKFKKLGFFNITIYGEIYGGKLQGMSNTYGKELKFVAFEIRIGDKWMDVPDAEEIVKKLGLEFVDYVKIPTKLSYIDAERDKPSVQAIRNGCGDDKIREGIVLRPIHECYDYRGDRIITKHKRDEFRETKTKREVNLEQLKVIEDTVSIADEWVTTQRLCHIIDAFPPDINIDKMGDIIKAMIVDIIKESIGEIIDSKETRKAIGKKTAIIFKRYLNSRINDSTYEM